MKAASMGNSKKENQKADSEDLDKGELWDAKIKYLSPISNPLASRKLTKKLYKVIRKAHKLKQIRKGVREVQKFVRKNEKGIVLLAGDTNPIEVICHMPVICEDQDLPYCYTPSKEDLGAACSSKRPTCMVMIKPHAEYQELYNEVEKEVKTLPLPV